MKLLVKLYATFRALLIASLASSGAASQESGFADQEEAEWIQIRQEGTPEAFQRYLERYPLGRHASEAFRCSIEALLCVPGAGEDRRVTRGTLIDMY